MLVATKKDFEPANRKKFCSRIAMGDYDAIIIGHSQFERIPLSKERQVATINRQIDDITNAIADASSEDGSRFTIKQLEKTKKGLQVRLEKLNDQQRKDDVVTFEQLGVDRLFVDEQRYVYEVSIHGSDYRWERSDLCNRNPGQQQYGRTLYHHAIFTI